MEVTMVSKANTLSTSFVESTILASAMHCNRTAAPRERRGTVKDSHQEEPWQSLRKQPFIHVWRGRISQALPIISQLIGRSLRTRRTLKLLPAGSAQPQANQAMQRMGLRPTADRPDR